MRADWWAQVPRLVAPTILLIATLMRQAFGQRHKDVPGIGQNPLRRRQPHRPG